MNFLPVWTSVAAVVPAPSVPPRGQHRDQCQDERAGGWSGNIHRADPEIPRAGCPPDPLLLRVRPSRRASG